MSETPVPKPPLKARAIYQIGRGVEGLGYVSGVLGLAYAFHQTINRAGIARFVIEAQHALLGQDDPPTTATFTGLICLIPCLVLIQIGGEVMAHGRPANPGAELLRRVGWRTVLLDRRPLTLGRVAAILFCALIALVALATAAAIWPTFQP